MSLLTDSRNIYLAVCAFVFPLLYLYAAWSITGSYLIILVLWLFWFIAPVKSAWGTFVIGANLLVLPALAWLLIRSQLQVRRLSRTDWLMLLLGTWLFVVLLVQSRWNVYEVGVAIKNGLWMLAWIPAIRLFRQRGSVDRFSGAMVLGLMITSILTIQEYFTGWNFHGWVDPGLVDTSPIQRFGYVRLAGPYGHGVATSIMVAMQLPFCFSWSRRFLSTIAFCLGVTALLLCQGRSAWIGLILSTAVVLLLLARRGKSYLVLALLLLAIGCVGLFGWWFDILLRSFTTSGGEISANMVRTDSWIALLPKLGKAPFFGYSEPVLAANFYQLLNVDFLEWPTALHDWFAFGPVYAVLVEIFFIAGGWLLFRSCVRHSAAVPLRFRLATLAGFLACTIALHANSAVGNVAVPLLLVYVASLEAAVASDAALMSLPHRSFASRKPSSFRESTTLRSL
jgi:hypothetical protein